MKVTYWQVEGSAEELESAPVIRGLLESLRDNGKPVPPTSDAEAESATPLPAEAHVFLEEWFPSGEAREAAEAFIRGCLEFGDVRAERGRSSRTSSGYGRYLRLHRRGAPVGAYAYVRGNSARVTLRLQRDAAENRQFAHARDAKGVYRVIAPISKREHVDEALDLARLAYDRAS